MGAPHRPPLVPGIEPDAYKSAIFSLNLRCKRDDFVYHSNFFIKTAIHKAFLDVSLDSKEFVELRMGPETPKLF